MTKREYAWNQGREAVRQKPLHAPSNPYNADEEPELFEAWDEGALSAGLHDIYTNGVLHKSERR